MKGSLRRGYTTERSQKETLTRCFMPSNCVWSRRLKHRAVLSLDDDLFLRCADFERAFARSGKTCRALGSGQPSRKNQALAHRTIECREKPVPLQR